VLAPRRRIPGGCCEARVNPDLTTDEATVLAAKFKALGDPTRLQIISALRKAAPQAICQCELTPLFDISQQALARHMKVLGDAGIVGRERRGVWTYYFIETGAVQQVNSWLS
jgi:ArsR family transcriptional regulator